MEFITTYIIDPKDIKEVVQDGQTITAINLKRKYGNRDRKIIKQDHVLEPCSYEEHLFHRNAALLLGQSNNT